MPESAGRTSVIIIAYREAPARIIENGRSLKAPSARNDFVSRASRARARTSSPIYPHLSSSSSSSVWPKCRRKLAGDSERQLRKRRNSRTTVQITIKRDLAFSPGSSARANSARAVISSACSGFLDTSIIPHYESRCLSRRFASLMTR